ncbi:MAG: phage tail protein [Candidatus Nanopelagicales bacterium]
MTASSVDSHCSPDPVHCPSPTCQSDGRIMSLNNNQVLYTILGSRFGGDGKNTFALPKVANCGDAKWGICIEGAYPSRP